MDTKTVAISVGITLAVLILLTQAPVVKDYGQFVVGGPFGK